MSNLEEQTQLLANWLADGRAFAIKNVPSSRTRALLQGIAGELLRSHDAVETFRREMVPSMAEELLPEWEAMVGIPDACFHDTAGTVEERRRNVVAKLVSFGVQTAADMITLAAIFGITATIIPGAVHGTFPFEFPMIFFPDERAARHTILVSLAEPTPSGFPYTFPFQFQSAELALVECLFQRVKPANVEVRFVDF